MRVELFITDPVFNRQLELAAHAADVAVGNFSLVRDWLKLRLALDDAQESGMPTFAAFGLPHASYALSARRSFFNDSGI